MESPKTWGRLEYAIHKAWYSTQVYIPGETQAQLIVRVCRSRGALLLADEEVSIAADIIDKAMLQHRENLRQNIIGISFEKTLADALREAGLAEKEPPRCLYSHFKTQK